MDCMKMDTRKTLVRLFNALPENKAVDIYADGILLFENIGFKEFTKYVYAILGTHRVEIYEAGGISNPILATEINLPVGQIFTLAIIGAPGQYSLLVVKDDINEVPSSQSAIGRTVNILYGAPEIDLLSNGEPSISNITYRDETPYVFIPSGTYEITVEESKTGNLLLEKNIEFKVNRIYTLYIVGNASNIDIVQSVDGNTYVCR